MYLKHLEIFGFKSFPQKAELAFEPGITVVVGPNGCGKSNILDATKWALGEQSPKSLRGTKMEDIIFNGTERYPPLNYAEVSLTFSNEDGYLPIDYKEVSIARRLYRSGESHYFINKNPVRLRDVQELFMGTGIGESTYSFIEQGRIEIFLGYKPEEKRLIFDEASGIVKYKDRKKETLKRLKETEDNLLRLEDILSEVRRQIRYLERQVEKARKYKEVEAALVETEKKIASLQCHGFSEQMNALLDELQRMKQQETEKEAELRETSREKEKLDGQLSETRKKLEQANAEMISLAAQIENSTSHIRVSEQRIQELEKRNQTIDANRASFSERLRIQEQRIAQVQQELDSFDQRVSRIKEAMESLARKKQELSQNTREVQAALKAEKTKVFELETERVNSRNTLIQIQTNLTSLGKRKQRLLLDKTRLEDLVKDTRQQYERVQEEVAGLENRVRERKEKKAALAAKERESARKKDEMKNTVIELDKELVELKSTYEFLRDLRTKYDSFSSSRKVTVLFDQEPKQINKLILSLKEAVIEKEGGVYRASLDAKVVSFDEAQLEQKIQQTRERIASLSASIAHTEAEIQGLQEEISHCEQRLAEEEKQCQERLQEREGFGRDLTRLQEESQVVESEMETVLSEIEALETTQKTLEEKTQTFEQSVYAAQEQIKQYQETLTRNGEEMNALEIEQAKREEQNQSLFKEREDLQSRIILFEEEKSAVAGTLAEIERERKTNEDKAGQLREEIETLQSGIAQGQERARAAEEHKQRLEEEFHECEKRIGVQNGRIRDLEEQVQKAQTFLYNKKLDIQGLEYEKEKVKDYLQQVYQLEFTPLPAEDVRETVEELSAARDKLKKRKNSLGETNLFAIEEFEELKKREEFLDTQKADLISSKENLKKAIQKINRTSKELFLETFEKIQHEFKRNFRFLFNGGRAQLILLDKENVLESGVEIEVQPPGKKLQNVSLLSGGEKALTAISLVFAIFRVRPSPLCVLDEIDAPLDEANVDRFNHLLREFSQVSQFLLITHNKKTMSNADVLYGVTMEEKGVSKLVSVKFAHQDQEEAASAAQ
ncbi:MAG: AAA family ATPase [Candidatus Omnitrophica bacterium]|nr:AAA family ATPase [Candidatus Omnitrophota bacterium]